jgi:RNA polymerase sigma-70 factor (ECF subfamily)
MRRELIEASELLRRPTPEAVEQAVDLLQKTVYSFSMKICGHREDAEDTMQEVLFRSLGHLTRFPDPEALAAWLYTVTKNRCRRIRRPRAQAPGRLMSLEELMPGQAELQALLKEQSDSPEHQVLGAEQNSLLHQAVLALPPALRVVLVLHDMEELTTQQIAKVLGIKPGTVAVRLHRGRLTLRKEMNRILKGETSPDAAGSVQVRERTRRSAQCRELFAKLSDYLDGTVNAATCEQIEAHMSACPNCVAFLNDLRTSIDRCKGLDVPCDPAVTARLRTLFTQEYLRMLNLSAGRADTR